MYKNKTLLQELSANWKKAMTVEDKPPHSSRQKKCVTEFVQIRKLTTNEGWYRERGGYGYFHIKNLKSVVTQCCQLADCSAA
jgi:hypothetical protein